MAMLHKWATGSHNKDNTKNDSEGNAVMQASGDFAYELPNTEPTAALEDGAGTGSADLAYTKEKAKQYTAAAEKNLGGPTKIDGTTVIAVKKLGWYNIVRMWKWRKIHKRYGKVGVTVATPNTNLYNA